MPGETYCECNGNFYSRDSGPIGLGISGELAVIYMEEFQIRAITASSKQ